MSDTAAVEIGDSVMVIWTGDAEKDLMYGGWCAVVRLIEEKRAFVDSDAYWRRTGKAQAVSFTGWFPINGLKKLSSPDRPGVVAGG